MSLVNKAWQEFSKWNKSGRPGDFAPSEPYQGWELQLSYWKTSFPASKPEVEVNKRQAKALIDKLLKKYYDMYGLPYEPALAYAPAIQGKDLGVKGERGEFSDSYSIHTFKVGESVLYLLVSEVSAQGWEFSDLEAAKQHADKLCYYRHYDAYERIS